MISLTNLELERIAEKFCENVDKVCGGAKLDYADPCDFCPVTDWCSKGKTGFIEFLKNKGGIYGDEL